MVSVSAAHSTEVEERAAGLSTVPELRAGPSAETRELREDTRNLAARAAFARAHSAATTTAERNEAIRHAEAPASVAEDFTAVAEATAAGTDNRSFIKFPVH